MMRITSTLIWLRKLSEMKAEGFEDSLGGEVRTQATLLKDLSKDKDSSFE